MPRWIDAPLCLCAILACTYVSRLRTHPFSFNKLVNARWYTLSPCIVFHTLKYASDTDRDTKITIVKCCQQVAVTLYNNGPGYGNVGKRGNVITWMDVTRRYVLVLPIRKTFTLFFVLKSYFYVVVVWYVSGPPHPWYRQSSVCDPLSLL